MATQVLSAPPSRSPPRAPRGEAIEPVFVKEGRRPTNFPRVGRGFFACPLRVRQRRSTCFLLSHSEAENSFRLTLLEPTRNWQNRIRRARWGEPGGNFECCERERLVAGFPLESLVRCCRGEPPHWRRDGWSVPQPRRQRRCLGCLDTWLYSLSYSYL